ncbi:MAG: hypothetical protein CFK52_03265 [Chloracidobacterium sp. CP2_5A]|nr:MAG: hypothetical protein CFK52_03265 [Chloracidobacterium sp. CP2_5A]
MVEQWQSEPVYRFRLPLETLANDKLEAVRAGKRKPRWRSVSQPLERRRALLYKALGRPDLAALFGICVIGILELAKIPWVIRPSGRVDDAFLILLIISAMSVLFIGGLLALILYAIGEARYRLLALEESARVTASLLQPLAGSASSSPASSSSGDRSNSAPPGSDSPPLTATEQALAGE